MVYRNPMFRVVARARERGGYATKRIEDHPGHRADHRGWATQAPTENI
jgi:hypothetical protein